MSSHKPVKTLAPLTPLPVLSAAQRQALRAQLQADLQRLDRRLAEQLGGQRRVDHAQQWLAQEGDEMPQHEAERAMDFALCERHEQAIECIRRALARLDDGSYGECSDCGEPIPFARLRAEPWAPRCVECEGRREQRQERQDRQRH